MYVRGGGDGPVQYIAGLDEGGVEMALRWGPLPSNAGDEQNGSKTVPDVPKRHNTSNTSKKRNEHLPSPPPASINVATAAAATAAPKGLASKRLVSSPEGVLAPKGLLPQACVRAC